tara:strand:- start:37 stop:405 length:369 start_codon:yes stop_codon:yes gene_type:complete
MMDYYGNFNGPTKNEAKKQIVDNVKKQIKNNLEYINNNKIVEIIGHIIEKEFPNNKTISSITGWSVFYYNNLTKKSIEELTKINKKIEIKHKKKIYSSAISLNKLIDKDMLYDILLELNKNK